MATSRVLPLLPTNGVSAEAPLTAEIGFGLVTIGLEQGTKDLLENFVPVAEEVNEVAAAVQENADEVAANTVIVSDKQAAVELAAGSVPVGYDTLGTFGTPNTLANDLNHAAGTTGQVLEDGANTGLYQKLGAYGTGSWVWKSPATVPGLDARTRELEGVITGIDSLDPLASSVVTAPDDAGRLVTTEQTGLDGVRRGGYGLTNGLATDDVETLDPDLIDVHLARSSSGAAVIAERRTKSGVVTGPIESERLSTVDLTLSEPRPTLDFSDQQVTSTATNSGGDVYVTDAQTASGAHILEAVELRNGERWYDTDTLDPDIGLLRTAVDADGNAVVLDAEGLNGGPYVRLAALPASERPEAMRWFHALTRKLKDAMITGGASVQCVIDVHGTSITYAANWYVGTVRRALVAEYGDAGAGWIDFTNGRAADPQSYPQSFAPNVIAGYCQVVLSAGWAASSYIFPGTNGGYQQSSTVGDKITVTGIAAPALSEVVLHALATSDGQARYRWNGGAWTALDLTGSGMLFLLLSVGMPTSGAWTLEIEVVSGTVRMAGMEARGGAAGVRVNKLGINEGNLAQLASIDEAAWIAAKSELGAHLTIIVHSTNDQGAARTPAQFADDLVTVIRRTLKARPYSDILIVNEAENFRPGNRILMQELALAARQVARDYGVGYVDMQPNFGTRLADYGEGGRQFFRTDPVHPFGGPGTSGTGTTAMADAILRFLKL